MNSYLIAFSMFCIGFSLAVLWFRIRSLSKDMLEMMHIIHHGSNVMVKLSNELDQLRKRVHCHE